MINALFCALFSELSEVDEAMRNGLPKSEVLEEKIDVLHFLLSIGYRIGMESVMTMPLDIITFESTQVVSEVMFGYMVSLMDSVKSYKFWSNKEQASTYILSQRWMSCFRLLWVWMLENDERYTNQTVIDAYKTKYEINIQRQKDGY
jgi:dimeric dUTPase (all-alpha-NTP-PPase superfamily)